MKLDLNLPTLLACLDALRERAIKESAKGIYDPKWRRAYQELVRLVEESYSSELTAEISQSVFVRH